MTQIKTPLKRGDTGIDVGRLQTLLIALEFLSERLPNGKTNIDSDFGGATETAVKAFQQQVGLPPTGVVDFETLQSLIPYRTARVVIKVSTDFKVTIPDKGRLSVTPRLVPMLTLKPMETTWRLVQPGTAAAPPSSSAGFVFQPQAGPQYLTPPVFYSLPPGSTRPGKSLAYQLQLWATYRTAKDGLHLEAGVGPGMSVNREFRTDDPRYTISGNVSFMVADIFAPGSFHLVSPQIQAGYYNNKDGDLKTVSSGLAGNIGDQMSYEIIQDKLMVIWTPGFWMQYDFKTGQVQGAPGFSLAIGGSF